MATVKLDGKMSMKVEWFDDSGKPVSSGTLSYEGSVEPLEMLKLLTEKIPEVKRLITDYMRVCEETFKPKQTDSLGRNDPRNSNEGG